MRIKFACRTCIQAWVQGSHPSVHPHARQKRTYGSCRAPFSYKRPGIGKYRSNMSWQYKDRRFRRRALADQARSPRTEHDPDPALVPAALQELSVFNTQSMSMNPIPSDRQTANRGSSHILLPILCVYKSLCFHAVFSSLT